MSLDGLPDVMTVRELKTFLRLNEDTCYELVRSGEIPAIHVGRRILIPKSGVAAWIERQLQEEANARIDQRGQTE